MKLHGTLLGLAVAAVTFGSTASLTAVAAPASAAAAPRAALQSVCRPKLHSITGIATIRPVKKTAVMEVMFNLQQRLIGSLTFTDMEVNGLGIWLTPPSVPATGWVPADVWRVKQPVDGLASGAVYRFDVDFQWLKADGAVIHHAELHGAPCKVPVVHHHL